ncbi:MAG: TIM barrel protein [Verrucomicrobia bacterium]|nr:TIM barrel protein [Verrucomicrobiota bacterium]
MKTNMNRRDFLKASGFAATATAILPATLNTAAAAAGKKRAIKKAIMWGTIGFKGSVLEKMRAVKAAGFEGVEPNGGMDRNEVKEALDATGLKAASVCCHTHWAKPLSDPNPAAREVGLEGLKLSLQDAKHYGATSVLLVPGVVNDNVTYDQCFERSIVEIRKAIPVAAELGVKIAIENVWNNFITKPEQAVRYLQEINSPHVGWHFDIGNIIRYGLPEEWIPALGNHILKLHIKEFGQAKRFSVKLLEGDNHWPAIMKALDAVGYDGWGISEQPGDQAKDAESLKDLSDRMSRIFAM